MAIREQLIIEGKNNTGRAFGQVQKDLKGMESSLGTVTKLATGLVAALGFQRLASSTVGVIRKFQDLGAVLKTVEGDADKAARSMDLIREFTKTTTFQLDDVTQAFITLKNAGLNPTTALMTDVGNIAAGMGKRIDDVSKAVFNATTGEFEMLKQLGIKVKTEGDKLTVLFRGTSRTIANDGKAIVGVIQEISQTSFSTGLADSAKTLTGAISNMKDAAEEFQVSIGDAGLTGELTTFTRSITEAINGNTELAHSIGTASATAVRGLSEAFQFLVRNADEVKGAFGAIAALGMASVIGRITMAVRALTIAIAANPLGALATAAIALIGYLGFKNGLGRTMQQLSAAVDYVGGIFSKFGKFLADKLGSVVQFIKEKFQAFVDALISGYNAVARIIPGMEELEFTAAEAGQSIAKYAKDGLDYAKGKTNEFIEAVAGENTELGKLITTVDKAGKAHDALTAAKKRQMEHEAALRSLQKEEGKEEGGTGTVTDKGLSKEQKKIQDALKKRVDAILESSKSETQVLNEKYNKDLNDLKDYYGNRIAFDTEYLRAKQSVEEKFEMARKRASERRIQKQFDIIKDGNMAELDLTNLTKNEIVDITKKTGRQALAALSEHNRTAFRLNQAFAIKDAIVSTAQGISKALALGPIGIPLAIAIGALGAAQIATIASQKYSGRAMGGPVGAAQSYVVGERGPEIFRAPAGGGMIDNGSQGGGGVNINFNVEAIDSDSFQDALSENRTAIISIVNEAVNDTGRRSLI